MRYLLIKTFRCGRPQCLTCPYILDGLKQYNFFSTRETRSTESQLDCSTNNLFYRIQCNSCHFQYIGLETKCSLKNRFNEHRCTIDNPNIKYSPTTAAKQSLLIPNHSSNDIQLIGPIEKILSKRDLVRNAREAHPIRKANTPNLMDSTKRRSVIITFSTFFALVLSFFSSYNLQFICYLHNTSYFVYCF